MSTTTGTDIRDLNNDQRIEYYNLEQSTTIKATTCGVKDCNQASRAQSLCVKHYSRLMYLKNRNSRRERQAEWRRNNPQYKNYLVNYKATPQFYLDSTIQRLKGMGFNVTSEDLPLIDVQAIIAKTNSTCYYCEAKLDKFSTTIDHMRPLTSPDRHYEENLTPCCMQCNSSKGQQSISVWLTRNTPYVETNRRHIINTLSKRGHGGTQND